MIRRILKAILSLIGSKYRDFRTGAMCSCFLVLVTRRAVVFWTQSAVCAADTGQCQPAASCSHLVSR